MRSTYAPYVLDLGVDAFIMCALQQHDTWTRTTACVGTLISNKIRMTHILGSLWCKAERHRVLLAAYQRNPTKMWKAGHGDVEPLLTRTSLKNVFVRYWFEVKGK